jgi:aminopeptidase N
MLTFFSERFGVTYPWPKYSQAIVRDYVSGAMENTSAVIFGDFVQKTRQALLDNSDLNEGIVAHEMAHHWFGDLVTCESWANLPLNESFANYSEYLWFEHQYGRDAADHLLWVQ